MTERSKWLTTEQARDLLNVSRRWLNDRRAEGLLSPVPDPLNRARFLWSRAELMNAAEVPHDGE